jgi:hypothetical protein
MPKIVLWVLLVASAVAYDEVDLVQFKLTEPVHGAAHAVEQTDGHSQPADAAPVAAISQIHREVKKTRKSRRHKHMDGSTDEKGSVAAKPTPSGGRVDVGAEVAKHGAEESWQQKDTLKMPTTKLAPPPLVPIPRASKGTLFQGCRDRRVAAAASLRKQAAHEKVETMGVEATPQCSYTPANIRKGQWCKFGLIKKYAHNGKTVWPNDVDASLVGCRGLCTDEPTCKAITYFPGAGQENCALYSKPCEQGAGGGHESYDKQCQAASVHVWRGKCEEHVEGMLKEPTTSAVNPTCCPVGSDDCTGCAKYGDGECKVPLGGFVKRMMPHATRVLCVSTPGWESEDGSTCADEPECNDVKNKGLSASQACCHCVNGGHVTATPFEYVVPPAALGKEVEGYPWPKTAKRYSLDEGCELSKYGVNFDGATGRLSGQPTHSEPFTMKCDVTAHQSNDITFTAPMHLSIGELAYASKVLIFSASRDEYQVSTVYDSGDWSMSCAPIIDWLTIDAATGTLTGTMKSDNHNPDQNEDQDHTGGVTDSGSYRGQAGGVCTIKLSTAPDTDYSTTVVVLRPEPWAPESFNYPIDTVSVTIGDSYPVFAPTYPSTDPGVNPDFHEVNRPSGSMRPIKFVAACDISPASFGTFLFDQSTGSGTINGFPAFDLFQDGSVSVAPSSLLLSLFDKWDSSDAARKVVELDCSIWGYYANPDTAEVGNNLKIKIQDNICWVKPEEAEKLVEIADGANSFKSADTCRSACRKDSQCSHYKWSGSKCKFYFASEEHDSAESKSDVLRKVTHCGDTETCLGITVDGKYHLSGDYCPIGKSVERGTVYKMTGTVPEDTRYLVKYIKRWDTRSSCKNDGEYEIRIPSANDYINIDQDRFELRGDGQECLSQSYIEDVFDDVEKTASISPRHCARPNITAGANEDAVVSPFRLDDPSTDEKDDFWLHPCDCVPPLWGTEKPVAMEVFNSVPSGSGNEFVPTPYTIVTGGFVCDIDFHLQSYYETETEAIDPAVCEVLCRTYTVTDCGDGGDSSDCKEIEGTCKYFWHGVQNDAVACRLYSACDDLVREPGTEGTLSAFPQDKMCAIANPAACWSVSGRRQFLTEDSERAFTFTDSNLHNRCDQILMLGGAGVDTCGRPRYSPALNGFQAGLSNGWKHRRLLPGAFKHGGTLYVSCWDDRYLPVPTSDYDATISSQEVRCVNGQWWGPDNKEGFSGFACAPCVQVVKPGYRAYDDRKLQELIFMNTMDTKIWIDYRKPGGKCVKAGSSKAELEEKDTVAECGDWNIKSEGDMDSHERLYQFKNDDESNCLVGGNDIKAGTCSSTDLNQRMKQSSVTSLIGRLVAPTKDADSGFARPWEEYEGNCIATEIPDGQKSSMSQAQQVCMASNDCLGVYVPADGSYFSARGSCQNKNLVDPTPSWCESPGGANDCNVGQGGKSYLKPADYKYVLLGEGYCRDAEGDTTNFYSIEITPYGTQQEGEDCRDHTWWQYEGKENPSNRACAPGLVCSNYNRGKNMGECKKGFTRIANEEQCKNACNADPACQAIIVREKVKGKNDRCFIYAPGATSAPDGWGPQLDGKTTAVASSNEKDTNDKGIECLRKVKYVEFEIDGTIDCGGEDWQGALNKFSLDGPTCRATSGAPRSPDRVLVNKPNGKDNYAGWDAGQTATWQQQLAVVANFKCNPGEAVTKVEISSPYDDDTGKQWQYWCSQIIGMGSCSPVMSEQFDWQVMDVRKMAATCEGTAVLNSLTFEHAEDWVRWQYKCCKTSGTLLALTPSGIDTDAAFDAWEGIYCPDKRKSNGLAVSGRISYKPVLSFKQQFKYSSEDGFSMADNLIYDADTGKWCIGDRCVSWSGTTPIGAAGDDKGFEAVAVSNFDGEFKGMGVPATIGGEAPGIAARGTQGSGSKSVQRPAPPAEVALDEFELEKVQYASECARPEFPASNNLGYDSSKTYALDGESDVNPCAFAEGFAWYSDDVWGKGAYNLDAPADFDFSAENDADGKVHTGVKDEDIVGGCRARELAREAHDLHLGFGHDMIEWGTGLIDELTEPACDAGGSAILAPIGLGVAVDIAGTCKDVLDIPTTYINMANDLFTGLAGFDMGIKGLKDCDVVSGGLSRIFCDVHCVRDAVVRGDQNINVNIKNATRVINSNLKTIAEWIGDNAQTESKWLGAKLDSMQDELLTQTTGVATANLVSNLQGETASMLADLEGLAAHASLNGASRAAAGRSLGSFLTKMSKFKTSASRDNATAAIQDLHGQVAVLRASLMSATSGRSGISAVSTMLQTQLAQLRQALKADMNILGVYKRHRTRAKAAFNASKSVRGTLSELATTNLLLVLDQRWWALRELLDAHLESVQAQTDAYERAINALQDYHSCKTAFEDLASIYGASKKAKASAVTLLQETWRKASNLIGEIAAMVADGDAFAKFARLDLDDAGLDACGGSKAPASEKAAEVLKQGITGQTFEQVGSAFSSLHALLYEYEKTTLPRPDLDTIRASAAFIVESYNATMKQCGVSM